MYHEFSDVLSHFGALGGPGGSEVTLKEGMKTELWQGYLEGDDELIYSCVKSIEVKAVERLTLAKAIVVPVSRLERDFLAGGPLRFEYRYTFKSGGGGRLLCITAQHGNGFFIFFDHCSDQL